MEEKDLLVQCLSAIAILRLTIEAIDVSFVKCNMWYCDDGMLSEYSIEVRKVLETIESFDPEPSFCVKLSPLNFSTQKLARMICSLAQYVVVYTTYSASLLATEVNQFLNVIRSVPIFMTLYHCSRH